MHKYQKCCLVLLLTPAFACSFTLSVDSSFIPQALLFCKLEADSSLERYPESAYAHWNRRQKPRHHSFDGMSNPPPTMAHNPQSQPPYQVSPQHQDTQNEPDITKHKQGKPRATLAFAKGWAWEAVGILASAVLIVSIVIILGNFNGREQPSWKLISLNSIVSWLNTLSKACVLFSVSDGIGQMKWVRF